MDLTLIPWEECELSTEMAVSGTSRVIVPSGLRDYNNKKYDKILKTVARPLV